MIAWFLTACFAPEPPELGTPRVVVIRNLPFGHRIGASDLELRPALGLGEVYSDPAAVVGQVVTTPMFAGDTVRAEWVDATVVPDGRVEASLSVDNLDHVAPGTWVDLLVSRGEPLETGLLVEGAYVLGTEGGLTVAVRPEQVPLASSGKVHVTLRNPIDISGVEAHPGEDGTLDLPEVEGPFVEVPVAAHELAPGLPITRSDLVMAKVPEGAPFPDPWLMEGVVGQFALHTIPAGAPIDVRRVDDGRATGSTIAPFIPRGMVGARVEPERMTPVAPGNIADVMVSVSGETRLLVQAVYVMKPLDQAMVVAVTREQAEKLAHVDAAELRVGMMLRSGVDVYPVGD